jgi:hypothetical protein
MTEIKTPDSLSNLGRERKRESGGTKNGFLRKEPSAASIITRNRGYRKEEVPSYQPVPQTRTSANFVGNAVFSSTLSQSVSGEASSAGQSEKVATEGGSFPCLYSNNSIDPPAEPSSGSTSKLSVFSSYYRKLSYALKLNIESFVEMVGIDRLGFLTLTFPDNCTDHKEAYKRFRSFNTNYLSKHAQFGEWLCVKERQNRGAWHYHLLIDCGFDVRTGIDWERFKKKDYRSANKYLRSLWADLRKNLPKYGFGRSELMPIRSSVKALSGYISKYLSKHIGSRKEEDKGVRLVSYSRNWPRSTAHFQWNTPNAKLFRLKLCIYAESLGFSKIEHFRWKHGLNWAWKLAPYIHEINPEQRSWYRSLRPPQPEWFRLSSDVISLNSCIEALLKWWHSSQAPQPEVQPLHGAGPLVEVPAGVSTGFGKEPVGLRDWYRTHQPIPDRDQ